MIDKKDKFILVMGATGQQGSAVLEALIRHGWKIRAFSRGKKPEALAALKDKKVDIALGDMNDPASLRAAMRGAYGVFAMTTSMEEGPEAEIAHGMATADAALAEGIRHFVFSSVGAADKKTGIPFFESKREIELYIRRQGIPATIFRPVSFMANYLRPDARKAILEGVFRSPSPPEGKLQLLALEDLGEFVAIALENPDDWRGREMEIASDELTMRGIADTFARVLGHSVRYEQTPVAETRKMGESMYKMALWHMTHDFQADLKELRSIYPMLTGFEQWLRSHGRRAFAKAS
jgi:uncharacterized protein YbjT (DUF2867 family)